MFQFTVTVAWGDCDEAGIVFYPNYFYWMDSAFQALLRERSLSQRKIREQFGALGTPIVESGAKFFAPVRYDEVLRIGTGVAKWSARSFRIEFRGLVDNSSVFEGFEVRVWATTGKDGRMEAAAVPAAFKQMVS